MPELCPCGSQLNYLLCCNPYLTYQQTAPTALALMRSRYTAYVKQNVEYLINTWQPNCKTNNWRNSIEQSFQNTIWVKLVIIDSGSESKNSAQDTVEFVAHYINTQTSQANTIHERSRFIKDKDRWFYIDGVKPDIGRNNPCLCGSGKKYKKCCG